MLPDNLVENLPNFGEETKNSTEEVGELSILNCAEGDIKITFDKDDPDDTAKAKKMIQDMLKAGYYLFIDVEGELKRVKKFNPDTEEYIVQDSPGGKEANKENVAETSKKRGGYKMKKTKATGCAPTSGG